MPSKFKRVFAPNDFGALVSSIAEATRSEAGWSRGDLRNNLFRNCARPSCIIGY